MPSLEVVELVLVQCKLVDNQYQYEVYTFALLHPGNLSLWVKC